MILVIINSWGGIAFGLSLAVPVAFLFILFGLYTGLIKFNKDDPEV